MKKALTLISLFAFSLFADAQSIYVWKGGKCTQQTLAAGLEVDMASDSITFNAPVTAPEVSISYSDKSAEVVVSPSASGVTYTVDGANVSITSSNVKDEIKYCVSGSSTNGSLTINGQYKLTVELDGLSLTSQTGAAIDIQCGKRIALVLKDGTTNTLADAASGAQKASLYSKGHLEIEGSGTLNVTGNKSHAIASKEYLQLKKSTGTINIVSSANDAIHAGQYFQMNGGTLNIDKNTTGDGVQAEVTSNAADENNGQIIIKGGTLNITVANQDAKAIKADSDIAISGGTFTLNANGNGSRGIQTDASMTVSEADNKTSIAIAATGSKCTLAECSNDSHNCMGIKVDGDLTVNAGTIKVTNTGKKSKGIKVGGTYKNNGGNVDATIDN